MKTSGCPRLFEAEAMRDDRLDGAALLSFARHASACAVCAREVEDLEALAQAVGPLAPPGGVDELNVLRERARLLAAFEEGPISPAPSRRPWLAGAAVAALAAGLLLFWRAEPRRPPVVTATVEADGAAAFSERIEDGCRKVVLSRGAIRVRVDHGAGRGRFLVVLPDGELEDRGTIFTVSVADGATTRVAVREGLVVLRLRDRAPVTVGAGESWAREPPLSAAPHLSAAPRPVVAPPAARPRRRAAAVPSRAILSPRPDPAADFRDAMSLLDAGANRPAAQAFVRFVEAHPRDVRAEDASYLLVIALQRSGDQDGLHRAAQEYLRRYPAGFRRAEVQTLSR